MAVDSRARRSRLREFTLNTGVFLSATLIAVFLLEFASRVVVPIAPSTEFMDMEGRPASLRSELDGTVLPSLALRQLSTDYDNILHTGPNGLRAPEPASPPEIVFIGDSFTFGQGLADGETFVAVYCARLQLVCANLGVPGTGTFFQRTFLQNTLDRTGWRPREVRLFMLAVTSSMASGNDLFDTLIERDRDAGMPPPPAGDALADVGTRSLRRVVYDLRGHMLQRSNLVRIAYSILGPWMRATVSPPPEGSQLAAALVETGRQIQAMEQVAAGAGARLSIYVLHPVQDLLRGTYAQTTDAIRSVAGAVPVIDTAQALRDDPRAYYFPYDGHFNARGAERVADLLLREDGAGR